MHLGPVNGSLPSRDLLARGPAPSADQGQLPPLGAPPSAGGPPIAVAGPSSASFPQVESWDEETYSCQAGDTFEAISQRYYHTDRYAQALTLFNRSHPRAAEGLLLDPPLVQPGTQVFIPPARILERDYARVIKPASAGDNPSSAPSPASAGASSSVPSATSPPTERIGPAAAGGKIYRVQGNGEMFLEVARRTLGNGDRWEEIYRLNPRFDPKNPIPGGQILRLPPDAQGAEEMP
ncbi:MAG: hypothetical protein JO112_08820 [Planctomycetes bacterium]|nr:hypothetical protein [Planctomycetota bacterium]